MSTHNICFCTEISKILCGYPLLSVAMQILVFLAPINKTGYHKKNPDTQFNENCMGKIKILNYNTLPLSCRGQITS